MNELIAPRTQGAGTCVARTLLPMLLCAVVCGLCARAVAERPQDTLEKARGEYFSVRNSDPKVRHPERWEAAIKGLEAASTAPKARCEALYLAATGARIVAAHRNGDEESFRGVIARLGRLSKSCDVPEYRAKARLLEAEVLVEDLDEAREGEKVLMSVVTEFPNTDSAMIAKSKLDAPAPRQVAAKNRDESLPLVVIDPGHGGEDQGAAGRGGLLEKDVVLAVARHLENLINASGKATAVLTRNRDEFVPLAERTNLANQLNADIFVSLHNNASARARFQGFETYYLDNNEDSASRKLAERENASINFEGTPPSDLSLIVSDLIQASKLEPSVELAHEVQSALTKHLSRSWSPVKDLGVKSAPFYVLVGAHMPCILVEMAFIDHPEDASKLADPAFRRDLAAGIWKGLASFLKAQKRASSKKE